MKLHGAHMTFYSELKTASVSTTPLSLLLQYIVYIFAIFVALSPNTSQISLKKYSRCDFKSCLPKTRILDELVQPSTQQ